MAEKDFYHSTWWRLAESLVPASPPRLWSGAFCPLWFHNGCPGYIGQVESGANHLRRCRGVVQP